MPDRPRSHAGDSIPLLLPHVAKLILQEDYSLRRAIRMGYRFRDTVERNVVKELFGDKDFNELVQQD
jgi:hypothetical protein